MATGPQAVYSSGNVLNFCIDLFWVMGKNLSHITLYGFDQKWAATKNQCFTLITGWWYTYPSEKYESQLGWWHSQLNGKSFKIPWFQSSPTRLYRSFPCFLCWLDTSGPSSVNVLRSQHSTHLNQCSSELGSGSSQWHLGFIGSFSWRTWNTNGKTDVWIPMFYAYPLVICYICYWKWWFIVDLLIEYGDFP